MKRSARPAGSRFQTRPLVEGALLAALTVVLILAGLYIPVLGMVALFLWPIPVLVIYLRHGFRAALLTLVVAGLVLSTFVGPVAGATTVVSLGTLALAFGFGASRRMSAGAILALGTGAALVSMVITLSISLWVMHINVFEVDQRLMQDSMTYALNFYSRVGVSAETLQPLRDMLDASFQLIPLIVPAIVILAACMTAIINYLVAAAVLKRLGHELPALPAFKDWRLPVWLVAGYPLAFALEYAFQRTGVVLYDRVAINLSALSTPFYVLQGLALAYFFLERLHLAKWLRVVVLVYVPLVPVLSQIVAWAGLFDMLFDMRHLARAEPGTAPS